MKTQILSIFVFALVAVSINAKPQDAVEAPVDIVAQILEQLNGLGLSPEDLAQVTGVVESVLSPNGVPLEPTELLAAIPKLIAELNKSNLSQGLIQQILKIVAQLLKGLGLPIDLSKLPIVGDLPVVGGIVGGLTGGLGGVTGGLGGLTGGLGGLTG